MPTYSKPLLQLGCPALRRRVRQSRAAGLRSILGYPRLAMLHSAALHCRELEVDFVEMGSYRGGSAGLIGLALAGTEKTLHVCDSFQGLPPPTEKDNFHQEGDFRDTSEAQVREGLRRLGLRAELHVGFFHQTLPALADRSFAFAHIDVDLYESVLECLRFCYPRMPPGSMILLDDYNGKNCLGAKAAADEFFADKREKLVPLAGPQAGVRLGTDRTDLFDVLRRRAGWTSALPLLGPSLYRT